MVPLGHNVLTNESNETILKNMAREITQICNILCNNNNNNNKKNYVHISGIYQIYQAW